jgi:hypothetical protein
MVSQIEYEIQFTRLFERILISMVKRTLYIVVVVPVLFALAACSSLKLPETSLSSSQSQSNPLSNFSGQPIEDKLALGTLKLEGTDKAITAAQAKTLLSLWKAVKTMSASNTTATAEITALYSQIQDAMTAQQIQAIKDLSLSSSDMQALMQKYSSPQAGSTGQKSTQTVLSQLQVGGLGGGPGGDPGGFPVGQPGGGGGAPPDAGSGIIGTGLQTTGTPVAGKSGASNRGSMNLMFVDPLIQLLTQRAGS